MLVYNSARNCLEPSWNVGRIFSQKKSELFFTLIMLVESMLCPTHQSLTNTSNHHVGNHLKCFLCEGIGMIMVYSQISLTNKTFRLSMKTSQAQKSWHGGGHMLQTFLSKYNGVLCFRTCRENDTLCLHNIFDVIHLLHL